MSDSTISIITPIYNAEKYIDRCLKSITEQSYKKLEIICVNDGSTDGSLTLLNSWANKDGRIIVINIHNQGVSKARNIGMENATGNYIMFVDIDDWIEPYICEICIDHYSKKDIDLIMWPYIREYENRSLEKNIFDRDILFDNKDLDILHRRFFGPLGKELYKLENADSLCTVWGKIYKKEIIKKNKIEFFDISEIGSYEDGLFNIQYFAKIKKALYLNTFSYHYWKENQNSITSIYNSNLNQQKKKLYYLLENEIEKNNYCKDYIDALNNRKCLDFLSLGINALADEASYMVIYQRLKSLLMDAERRLDLKNFKIRYLPLHWKVFYFFIKTKNVIGYYLLMKIICGLRK